MSTDAIGEIRAGARFGFGENWQRFLDLVDEEKIEGSQSALADFLGTDDLSGRSFVDVGSGSGLSSLAARRMGATVFSFDFDPESVAATEALRRRHDTGDADWTITQGSVLDRDFVSSLGQFDIVYSWGVLHHTGAMWDAIDATTSLARPGSLMWLALYNDQGRASRNWTRIKKAYNEGGELKRHALVRGTEAYFQMRSVPGRLNALRKGQGFSRDTAPRARGMDRRRDLVDWVGGYPFEVSKPEQVFDFCRDRGFRLERMRTCGGGLGCNEYLFMRQ